MNMKRGFVFLICLILLFSLMFVSAGLFNKNKITGQVSGDGELVVENPKDNAGNYILVSKYFYGSDYTLYAGKYCEEIQGCTGFKDVVVKDDSVKACRCDDYWGCEGQSCVTSVASSSYWERVGSVTCTGCSEEINLIKSEISYPSPFIVNGIADVAIIYGELDSSLVKIQATNIQSDLQSRVEGLGELLVKDSELDSVKNKNLIIVGTCNNSVVSDLLNRDCSSSFIESYYSPYYSSKKILLIVGSDSAELSSLVSGYLANHSVEEPCSDTCTSLGYECGTQTICGVDADCGTCNDGEECIKGVCIEEGSCTDSDGGKKYYKTGYIKFGGGSTSWDICSNNFSLREFYCDGDAEGAETYYCENGCGGRRCLFTGETAKQFSINKSKTQIIEFLGTEYEIEAPSCTGLLPPRSFNISDRKNSWTFDFEEVKEYYVTEELSLVYEGCASIPTHFGLTFIGKLKDQSCDLGCSLDGKCYPFGYRKAGKYCSENYEFVYQLEEDSVCENNFECESNVCVNGQCISGSLIQRIIEWFRNILH